MTRLRLYIAGPMTGYDDFNYPAFFAAADQLQAVGYHTINPADIGVQPDWFREDYLRVGLKRLMDHAQGVALLPGWERSGGARLEAHTAEQLGLPVRPLAVWLAYAELQSKPVTWALGMTSNALPPVHLVLDDFSPRPDAERAEPLLHVYAQTAWHDPVRLVGNRAGLLACAHAIAQALADGRGAAEAMTADGETYDLTVRLDDSPWEGPAWHHRLWPYTADAARDRRPEAVPPASEDD